MRVGSWWRRLKMEFILKGSLLTSRLLSISTNLQKRLVRLGKPTLKWLQRVSSTVGLRMESLLILTVLIAPSFYFYEDYWRWSWYQRWGLQLCLIAVYIGWAVAKRIHWALFLPITITLLNGIYVCLVVHKVSWTITEMLHIQRAVSSSLITFVLMATFADLYPKQHYKTAVNVFAGLCLVDSLVIFAQYFLGWEFNTRGGIYGNPSMSACFIAATQPFLLRWKLDNFWRVAFVAIPIGAIILTQSSVGLGCLALTWGAILYREVQTKVEIKRERVIGLMLVLFVVGFVINSNIDGFQGYLRSSGRFSIWELGLEKFIEKGPQGIGSTVVTLPWYQLQAGHESVNLPQGYGNLFMWHHSDWLQLFTEGGLLLLLSWLSLYAVILKRAWRSWYLFASCVSVGGMMMFNYPLRLPVHALLITMLAVIVLKDEEYGF